MATTTTKARQHRRRGKASRAKIPLQVRLQVVTESGYMCANPRCKHMLTLDLHHLQWVREGGGNDAKNLIALRSNCHDAHTHGQIPRQSLDAWKQMLMLVSGSLDRDSLDLLLFLHSYEKRQQDECQRRKKWEHDKEEEYEGLAANPDTTQRHFAEHQEKWKVIEPPYFSETELRGQRDGLLGLVCLIRTGLVAEGDRKSEVSDGLCVYY